MIQLSKITLHFGQRCLFDGVTLQVKAGDKIGLVGKNGAGKSTLLKVISGDLTPETGQVALPSGVKIGYLEQDIVEDESATVRAFVEGGKSDVQGINDRIEEIGQILSNDPEPDPRLYDELSDLHHRLEVADAAGLQEKVELVLGGLGFKPDELDKSLGTFSGGWQMRAVLAKLLIDDPDVLLLDEPTNHLDIHSIHWLEGYLTTYQGALILISHDRLFLDRIITRVVEIENAGLIEFKSNYSKYLLKKEELREHNAREYKNQQKYIEKTQVLINKFRAKKNKAAFAQTLIRKLEKLEMVELMEEDSSKIELRFPEPVKSGKVVLRCEGIAKSYGDKHVIMASDLEMERGQKLALVGENGSGKSTLVKILTGEIEYEGEVELGHNVKPGYFAQDSQEALDGDKTVFETIDDIAAGDVRKNVRTILGSFLFSGDDTDKKVKVLSGGEKTRLALCKLMLEPYNFLILDEPTNHLDIRSKAILREALTKFPGTVLVVSHDREFVGDLTEHLLHIRDKEVKHFHYGITEYLQKHAQTIEVKSQKAKSETPKASTNDYKERKKAKNRIAKLERDIAKLEAEMATLKEQMAQSDTAGDNELYQKFYELELTVEQHMEEWEGLSETYGD